MPATVAAAVTIATVAAGLPSAAAPAPRAPEAAATAHLRGPRVGDLPADGPPALYQRQPALHRPAGWPLRAETFPRTSGTGRYARGGFFWTDYLYDDHGAYTASPGDPSVAAGTPGGGTYTYADAAAHNNGADIFRAAVARGAGVTRWRVDWTTLADPRVPIAEWTIDRDGDAGTGVASWPAEAGVSSAGIDTAIVVSAHHARVLDAGTGRVLWSGRPTVDRVAKSFVVTVPDRVLHPAGTWRVRLAAGVADGSGTAFAPPPGVAAGQAHVYNVAFRTPAQETPTNNFWNDMAQAKALAAGDVTAFATTLSWAKLAAGTTTPEAHPLGWSDRWYVSSVDLGPGVLTDPATIGDAKPNYLGRVQPYAVYVPQHRPAAAPLTFLLHSLTQNHNQYAATTPNFTRQACEDRQSICVTTLGRGPDGGYHGYAELDFWQVWHDVASAYRLDPDRTIISGYSMGGIGANQLAIEHPDVFARSITLAGGVGNVPGLANLRWVPTYLAGGAADELVWVSTQKAEADTLAALGYRYRWVVYPEVDHVAYELADSFGDAAAYMRRGDVRAAAPAHVTYTWTPRTTHNFASQNELSQGGIEWSQQPKLGIGTTGAYWVRHLVARTKGADATVDAVSSAAREQAGKGLTTQSVAVSGGPGPGLATELEWWPGTVSGRAVAVGHRGPAHRTGSIQLRLGNVRSLALLLPLAGFTGHWQGLVRVDTDGATVLHLGARTVHLTAGKHVVRFTT